MQKLLQTMQILEHNSQRESDNDQEHQEQDNFYEFSGENHVMEDQLENSSEENNEESEGETSEEECEEEHPMDALIDMAEVIIEDLLDEDDARFVWFLSYLINIIIKTIKNGRIVSILIKNNWLSFKNM